MNRFARLLILLPGITSTAMAKAVDNPSVIDLWPVKAPDDNAATIGGEKFIELKTQDGKTYTVAGKSTKWLTNVTKPSLTIYRPQKEKDTGATMIICPGGGYHNLGWDVEGEEVAAWLNSIGVTGIILKYRCPRRPGDVQGDPPIGPLKDAQRAVSLVRSKAKEWGIDPSKIGMIGFSAGGHLVGATATSFEKRAYEPIDDVDKISCRPDFAIMMYSGYFQVKATKELSPTIHKTSAAPPMFLVHASDDSISEVDNTVTMYLAMKHAGVPVEMHIYETGGHGFAVRPVNHPCSEWTVSFLAWLRLHQMLPREQRADNR